MPSTVRRLVFASLVTSAIVIGDIKTRTFAVLFGVRFN